MEFVRIHRADCDFKQAMTADQIERIVRRAFGERTKLERAREIGMGYFNSTFVLTIKLWGRFVLRAAPPTGSRLLSNEESLMRREYAIYPYFTAIGSLMPRIVAMDMTHDIVPRDCMLQQYMEGEAWETAEAKLTVSGQDAVWGHIGSILKQVHRVVGDRYGYPPPGPVFDCWSDVLLHIVNGFELDWHHWEMEAHHVPAQFIKMIEKNRDLLNGLGEPRLLHGDFWPRNLLIDSRSGQVRVSAVLDWDRALWGDPLAEWVFLFRDMPDTFWRSYGELDDPTTASFRIRLYKGIQLLSDMLSCRRLGLNISPELYREVLLILKLLARGAEDDKRENEIC